MSVIAVDVDGVVADLGTAWLNRYNKDYDDHLTNKDITEWGTELFVKPECGKKIYDYLEDPTLYDETKPIPGALEVITSLREQYGHRIIYATSSTAGATGAKYAWLKRHGFLSEDYTSLSDYIEVRDKSLVRADFLIDDGYHNLVSFTGGRKHKGIMFVQPWNAKKFWPLKIKGGWKKFDVAVLEA